MRSRTSLFAEPEHAVLSLSVQAAMVRNEPEEQDQFHLLIRHFLGRFFNNEMVADDGDTRMRAIQIAYAIALPGLCIALYLFVPYHAPGGRSYWSQVSDHYLYVMYSFVAMGVLTIFEWDMFFPDMVDILTLSPLPIRPRNIFLARILAVSILLGLFLLSINALGAIFFPAATDPATLIRSFFAHLIAVTMGGAFAAAFFVSLQSVALTVLGERAFRILSPFLQGLSVMLVLTILFLFPVLSHFLPDLLNSGEPALRYFPPFWFLGIYQRIFEGPAVLPIFAQLAKTGCMATVSIIALAAAFYPLAYMRRTRHLVEGSVARSTENLLVRPLHWILHATILRDPARRGIYHFISYTLLRTPRHRVYLAMYGGLGVALIASSAIMLNIGHGHVRILLSPGGLRTAVPIVSFWTIVGLRNAFLSPVDRRGNWIFRLVQGRPGFTQFNTTKSWVLQWAMILTLGTVAMVNLVAPHGLRNWRFNAGQIVLATGLCVLLTDFLFFKVRTLPFTGAPASSTTKLAFILIQYFGLFPPFVLIAQGLGFWLEIRTAHLIGAVLFIAVAHFAVEALYRRRVSEFTNLIDLDGEEEEFPQRLGLRY